VPLRPETKDQAAARRGRGCQRGSYRDDGGGGPGKPCNQPGRRGFGRRLCGRASGRIADAWLMGPGNGLQQAALAGATGRPRRYSSSAPGIGRPAGFVTDQPRSTAHGRSCAAPSGSRLSSLKPPHRRTEQHTASRRALARIGFSHHAHSLVTSAHPFPGSRLTATAATTD